MVVTEILNDCQNEQQFVTTVSADFLRRSEGLAVVAHHLYLCLMSLFLMTLKCRKFKIHVGNFNSN